MKIATEEIKAWVLSFGTKAEVLEPESLRAEVAHELTESLARYTPRHLAGSNAAVPTEKPTRRRAK